MHLNECPPFSKKFWYNWYGEFFRTRPWRWALIERAQPHKWKLKEKRMSTAKMLSSQRVVNAWNKLLSYVVEAPFFKYVQEKTGWLEHGCGIISEQRAAHVTRLHTRSITTFTSTLKCRKWRMCLQFTAYVNKEIWWLCNLTNSHKNALAIQGRKQLWKETIRRRKNQEEIPW